MQTHCILIASNFVTHPHILIFSVKIASLSPYWLQIKFFMSLFFWLFTFAINFLWHRKFVTADINAVFVNNQHGVQWRRQDFNKKFVFEGYTAKRLTDEFPEKRWTKRGVNKLLQTLRDTGTQFTDGQKFQFLISQGTVETRLRWGG